mgnify:FL=1
MKYIILDDFTPPSIQNQLSSALLGANTDWKFRDSSSGVGEDIDKNDVNIKESVQFVHEIFHDHEKGMQSPLFNLAQIPLMFLEHHMKKTITMPIRIKANMLLQDEDATGKYHSPHIDVANQDAVSMVYYLHDCDGDTILFDKKLSKFGGHTDLVELDRVTPKQGRAVIFNSNRFHASSSPVQNQRRVIINYVFFADKTFLTKSG